MAEYDIHKGDDRTIQVTVTDDGTSSGTAVDCSTATIEWKVWRLGEDTADVDKTQADAEVTVAGASNERIDCELTDTITAALVDNATYKSRVTVTISGNTETVDEFTFKALPDAP